MKVYVSAIIQHSIFSSGYASCSLQIAEAIRHLGHDVSLLNILDNGSAWYDDCKGLKNLFHVVQKSDFLKADCIDQPIKGDLLIDVIGALTGEDRAKIATTNVLFMGKPPIHNEIERNIYFQNGFRVCYDNINEIWTWDFYGANDFLFLSLLARCNVRPIPFVWSPLIIEAFLAESKIPTWPTVAKSAEIAGKAGWIVRIAETNNSTRSSCTLPTVSMAEFHRQHPGKVQAVVIHNAEQLKAKKFFQENILLHCKGDLEPILVGRTRVTEWCVQPRSILLGHCRFTPFRYLYLDAAWLGIPLIHNSPLLKSLGGVYEKYYYANNSVTETVAALASYINSFEGQSMEQALKELDTGRQQIMEQLSILRPKAKESWTKTLKEVLRVPMAAVLPPMKNIIATNNDVAPTKIFRIQFVGMWNQFQNDYNFFTLLLGAYFDTTDKAVKVVGCGPEYKGHDIHVRIMGPFGCSEPLAANIPTVFTTGENIGPLPDEICSKNFIQLQLGYSRRAHNGSNYFRLPLWMMSIDWFGANNERLVNPKVVPLSWAMNAPNDNREKFCSFVVTNPSNEKRNKALELIEQIGHVDSAGRYKNNCGDAIFAGLGGGGGELKKVEFLRNYRFSITYENSAGEGYVTEKLFHAKAAGSIPIYWGDAEAAAEDFVAGGWIMANDRSDEELVTEVRRLENNREEREAMASTPILNVEKAEAVRKRLAEVANAILRISSYDSKNEVETLGIKNW